MFLNHGSFAIGGLKMHIIEDELVDVEFADDTTLYVEGDLPNLDTIQSSLKTFCIASRCNNKLA